MHSLRIGAALVVSLGTLLSACTTATTTSPGAKGGTPATASAKPTPAGALQTSSALTLIGAKDWTNRTSTLTPSVDRTPLLLMSADISGTFAANSNDQRGDLDVAQLSPAVEPAGWQAYLTSAATSFGKGSPSAPQTLTIGGDTAMAVTYPIDTQGTPGKAEDIIVNHKGVSYNFTFTDSSIGYAAHIGDVTAMLDTVTWK